MDSMAAFVMGQVNRDRPARVFDWDKAARILRDAGATEASAGLAEDWPWTAGDILRDGAPVAQEDTYTYLSSTWATPELRIEGGDSTQTYECWQYEKDVPDWDEHTYWPESARAIFGGAS